MPAARARRRLLAPLVLVAAALLLHVNGLRTGFLGDDYDILRKTVAHRSLGDALRMTFVGNWGPVSYVQFYLDHLIGGLDPLIYHLNNVLWLAVAMLALWGLLRTVWPEDRFPAWTAALLFATHPGNDQAINYVCARSHTTAAALAVLALALYARYRLAPPAAPRRAAWLAAAWVVAFLAGLSKESALTLPAWIAALDWLLARRDGDPAWRGLARAAAGGVLFALAAAAVFVARWLVIGGLSRRLEQAPGLAANFLAEIGADVPLYGLTGALPLPWAWIDTVVLERWRPAGWALVAAGVACGAWCALRNASRGAAATRSAGLFALGLTVVAVTLLPTLYAGLSIQRRYWFISNVGFVLMATAALIALEARLGRRVRALVVLLVVAGALGTLQRNDLHRRTGLLFARLLADVRGAPLTAPAPDQQAPRLILLTLPRFAGGDRISGALLMHRTDLYSALLLHGTPLPRLHTALQCDHAEDYSAQARFLDPHDLLLSVSFRTRRAFAAALARDPDDDRHGGAATAARVAADPRARRVDYRVSLHPEVWTDPANRVYLYSDGAFHRLRPPQS